jgi:hypothetical protein
MPILGAVASSRLTAVPNSFESIATATVGSGGTTTITFSSIPQTYAHLQIRIFARANLAANVFSIGTRYNSDSGTNYVYHAMYGQGSSALAGSATSVNYDYAGLVMGTNPSNNFAADVFDILDYKNTNKFKTTRNLGGGDVNGAGGFPMFASSLWQNTSAINSISISTAGFGDFLQYSHFALYGIKGS